MKKIVIVQIIFLLAIAPAFATEELKISAVRTLYKKAAFSENKCTVLLQKLKTVDAKENPLYSGYKGSATMMMAKYTINPIYKFSYFLEGKELLEEAIHEDNDNIELRFLRFTVQNNIPAFLNYTDNMEEDIKLIVDALPGLKDSELKSMIERYFTEEGLHYKNTNN